VLGQVRSPTTVHVVDELTRLAHTARCGNEEDVRAFVASQRDVWRLCAHLVDRDTASDLAQETYLRALPALRRFRGDASARTWLLSIARRVCADELRRRYRRPEYPMNAQADVVVADFAPQADLLALVDMLEPGRRAAFVLTQLLGCSYEETATITGTPIGTVRSRVARARDDLIAWTTSDQTRRARGSTATHPG
jgi:RNA polymerase sigma-70 factor (ECF subfamily)